MRPTDAHADDRRMNMTVARVTAEHVRYMYHYLGRPVAYDHSTAKTEVPGLRLESAIN